MPYQLVISDIDGTPLNSETIAFGDSMINDGPMIEAAGCGVVMKNAHNSLIEKAQYVTEKDNNEDGVGSFLRGLFRL